MNVLSTVQCFYIIFSNSNSYVCEFIIQIAPGPTATRLATPPTGQLVPREQLRRELTTEREWIVITTPTHIYLANSEFTAHVITIFVLSILYIIVFSCRSPYMLQVTILNILHLALLDAAMLLRSFRFLTFVLQRTMAMVSCSARVECSCVKQSHFTLI